MAAKKKRLLKTIPGDVCKPCWELHYCPYGAMVEYFPIPSDISRKEVEERHAQVLKEFTSGDLTDEGYVNDAIARLFYSDPLAWDVIDGYDPEVISCRFYGHSCPVFFMQTGASETKQHRRVGRYIPREMMLKVVRRDGQVCQECYKYVPDPEIQFDHVIPLSRGGRTSVDNLRLLCGQCNNKKSDKVDDFLIE